MYDRIIKICLSQEHSNKISAPTFLEEARGLLVPILVWVAVDEYGSLEVRKQQFRCDMYRDGKTSKDRISGAEEN